MRTNVITPLSELATRGLCRDRDGGTDRRNPVLVRLLEQRDEQIRFVDETLARVEADGRDLVDAERNNLTAARSRIGELDAQIEPLEEFEELRSAHRSTTSRYSSSQQRADQGGDRGRGAAYTEPRGHEYRSAGEIIVDRVLAHDGNADAVDRLVGAGLHRDLTGQARSMVSRVEDQQRALVHQTTANTPGLLPEPIVGAIDNDTDAQRPFMSSLGVKPLGGIPGKTFERPTVTQHTQVGEQAAEKDELVSRQLVISGVPFSKRTFGGALNVSRQDIDWTSPAAWDAILTDLQEQYALETENAAADAFAAAIVATVENGAAVGQAGTLQQIATAFYAAASGAYGGSGRLPNHVWMSLDMWALYGPVLDTAAAALNAGAGPGNDSAVNSFEGQVLRLPRTVVPSFPAGTLIVGVKERTEVYEERIGLLQAVQPSVLGVEIAYGGYMASGTLRPGAFRKIINAA
jgi:HK97 family phage major capsid protein